MTFHDFFWEPGFYTSIVHRLRRTLLLHIFNYTKGINYIVKWRHGCIKIKKRQLENRRDCVSI